ncbi:MAG: ABC transporter ATP-binding protein/permease [Oscillospiraceae bacterium]|nr:ABC transporter ATP-binding protein/permease [Oscillospiraceae bacterium]
MNKHILRRLLPYVWRYWPYLLGSVVGAIASVLCFLLLPVLVGRAIDYILGVGQVDFIAVGRLLQIFVLAALGKALFQWAMFTCTRYLSAKVGQAVRRDAYGRISEAPLSAIDGHPHGDLVSRLVNDAEAVADGVLSALSSLLPGAVTVLCTMVLMFTLDVRIALVVIIATPVSILPARFIAGRTRKYFRAQSEVQGRMGAYVNEMVTNGAQVAAMACEGASQADFDALNERFFRSNVKAVFYSSLANPMTRFVNAMIYLAVGVLGALAVTAGGITVGSLSAFLAYAHQYTRPFNEATAVLTQIQAAGASAERLFAVIDRPPETADAADAKSPDSCKGLVELKDVSFAYAPHRPVIRDVNLTARPGTHVALVGPTGSGKTTLINLLMRFYETDSGTISVDGVPVTQIARPALRRMSGMVLQDSWICRATVAENIAYGRPDAVRAEIEAAAKAASAHSFILGLPEGYDTVISGDSGLSAGQKQLISIARIFLTKPDMLLLDEATSSLDTRTELLLGTALARFMEGRTSFVVAHRLATIRGADWILVLDHGEVAEAGTHADLLARGGLYARLYHSQFGVLET